jgi:chromosome segregation ATPase
VADSQPITEAELSDAIANFDFFAVRLKGIIALGERLKPLRSLIAAEGEKRALLARLDARADEVRAIVATADAEQARLDGITAKTDSHRRQTQAEAERITGDARSAATEIVEAARRSAAKILSDAASAEASLRAAETTTRQTEIAELDAAIAARRGELEGINGAIRELRARIGA